MKHLKKFLALALVCVMALTVLTGCGKSTADYQRELNGALTSAKISVKVDDHLNKGAEQIVKAISSAVKGYLSGKEVDYDKLVEDTAKKANLADDTQWCMNINAYGQVINYGFDHSESTSTAKATNFFVKELESYNASHTEKLTKVGVAMYRVPVVGIEIVIMLAGK